MPYIKPELRKKYDKRIDKLVEQIPYEDQDGDINYIVSRLVTGAFKADGGWRYGKIARAVGCLHCVVYELYRRIGENYENKAIDTNGDIKEYIDFDETMGNVRYESGCGGQD